MLLLHEELLYFDILLSANACKGQLIFSGTKSHIHILRSLYKPSPTATGISNSRHSVYETRPLPVSLPDEYKQCFDICVFVGTGPF
jgi:hypothetical protein